MMVWSDQLSFYATKMVVFLFGSPTYELRRRKMDGTVGGQKKWRAERKAG